MKTYRVVLFLAAWLTYGNFAHAQIYGIRGGVNFANMKMKFDGENLSDDFKMKPGFILGPTADFPLTSRFSIETGLLVSTKGFRTEEKETFQNYTYEYKSSSNLTYLDIPITFKTTFELSDNTALFLSAGPYAAIGLSGSSVSEDTFNGETKKHEEDIKWGSDKEEDHLRRFDYGLSFGGGIEFGALQLGIFYNQGLANISNYTENDSSIRNKVLNLSVSYRFVKN